MYTTNIVETNFSDSVLTGSYYCEQAKVKYVSYYDIGKADAVVYTSYIPNFKCEEDGNGKGIVNSNIGLLTYDEMIYSGAFVNKTNADHYLTNDYSYWLMSPNGLDVYTGSKALIWRLNNLGNFYANYVTSALTLRPVINLKSDVTVTGTGTSDDHWVVQ